MKDDGRQSELNLALELVFHGYKALTARPDLILSERGLQRVHHRVLYFVGRRPGLPVGELLATLGVSKQALNAPLRQLIEMGLVVSLPSPEDGRARLLSLSREGERLERSLTGVQRKHLERVFGRAGRHAENGWREVMELLAAEGS
ncbi:MAG: MarR family transcriptional regulator [Fibrobacteria bacterium]|nr:MarR family transcriptional regulator [Fibrobacteria bacterium]